MVKVYLKLSAGQLLKVSRAAKAGRAESIRITPRMVSRDGMPLEVAHTELAKIAKAKRQGKGTNILFNGAENTHLIVARGSGLWGSIKKAARKTYKAGKTVHKGVQDIGKKARDATMYVGGKVAQGKELVDRATVIGQQAAEAVAKGKSGNYYGAYLSAKTAYENAKDVGADGYEFGKDVVSGQGYNYQGVSLANQHIPRPKVARRKGRYLRPVLGEGIYWNEAPKRGSGARRRRKN